MSEGTFIFLESSLKERGLEDVVLRAEISSSEHAFLLCPCPHFESYQTVRKGPRPLQSTLQTLQQAYNEERGQIGLGHQLSPCGTDGDCNPFGRGEESPDT